MQHSSSEIARFQTKVKHGDNGCLIWTGYKSPDGYGRFRATRDGRSSAKMAHRVAWEHAHGAIPDGMQVDHTCFNRACVNPNHLRLVTNKQNCEHRSGARPDNRSGVRGVQFTRNGRWKATAFHNGKHHIAGYFDTIPEAEAAAIALRNELFTHNIEAAA